MTGILLLNLGTPEGPTPSHVKTYLKEFLMDPFVIDIHFLARWFLVNQIILRTRPKKSAAAYQKIWTSAGSPLLFHTVALAEGVQKTLGSEYVVTHGMRYGNPSLKSALEKLTGRGVDKILVVPLYPQYSLAATESSVDACKRAAKELQFKGKIKFLPAFYNHRAFIDSFKSEIDKALKKDKPDMILFSFHGIPERHIKKTDSRNSCVFTDECCENFSSRGNTNCYRGQCYATAKSLALELGLSKAQYTVGFQSRLGRTPWIKPYTDFLYKELAEKGVKKLAVVCPSFVADCLETLEEIDIRGRDDFKKAGGEDLIFIPCLNSSAKWIDGLTEIILDDLKRFA